MLELIVLLCFIASAVLAARHFSSKKSDGKATLTLPANYPFIELEKLLRFPMKANSVTQYQSGEKVIWLLQLTNRGPVAAWTSNSALAWQLKEMKRGNDFMLVEDRGEIVIAEL